MAVARQTLQDTKQRWSVSWSGNLVIWISLATLTSVALGYMVPKTPAIALIILAPMLLVAIIRVPQMRLLAIVLGALLVLGSEETGITERKALYFLVFLLSVLLCSLPLLHGRDRAARHLFAVSIMAVLYVAFTGVVASYHNVNVSSWVRSSIPMLFLLSSPIVAYYLKDKLTIAALERYLILIAALSTIGTVARWAELRGVASFSLPVSILPSSWPAMVFLAYGFALVIARRASLGLYLLMGAMMGSLLITGTRGRLLLFAGLIIGAAFGTWRSRGSQIRPSRLLMLLLILGMLSVSTIAVLGKLELINIQPLLDRYGTIINPEDLAAGDQGLSLRTLQTSKAWEAFLHSPLVGNGPGYVISYTYDVSWTRMDESTVLDTPIAFLMRYGIFGLIALGMYLNRLRMWIQTLGIGGEERIFLWGILMSVVVYLPLLDFSSDQGAGLAAILVLTVVAVYSQQRKVQGE